MEAFKPQSRPITVKDWVLHVDNHLSHICREVDSIIPSASRLQVIAVFSDALWIYMGRAD